MIFICLTKESMFHFLYPSSRRLYHLWSIGLAFELQWLAIEFETLYIIKVYYIVLIYHRILFIEKK